VILVDASKTIITTAAALLMLGISLLRETSRCGGKSDPPHQSERQMRGCSRRCRRAEKLASGSGLTRYCRSIGAAKI
jgi:hypothetical protein